MPSWSDNEEQVGTEWLSRRSLGKYPSGACHTCYHTLPVVVCLKDWTELKEEKKEQAWLFPTRVIFFHTWTASSDLACFVWTHSGITLKIHIKVTSEHICPVVAVWPVWLRSLNEWLLMMARKAIVPQYVHKSHTSVKQMLASLDSVVDFNYTSNVRFIMTNISAMAVDLQWFYFCVLSSISTCLPNFHSVKVFLSVGFSM